MVNSETEEADKSSLYEDVQAKLKKILGIENVFKVRHLEHGRREYFPINEAKNLNFSVENWHRKAKLGLVSKMPVPGLSGSATFGWTDSKRCIQQGLVLCAGLDFR